VLDGEIVNISHDIAILCGLDTKGIGSRCLRFRTDSELGKALIGKINRCANEGVVLKENFMFAWL
jgi:hypothetical protein